MKKITFSVGTLQGGGAERVVALLANKFAENGYDTSIILIFKTERQYELDKRVKLVELFEYGKNDYNFSFIFKVVPALVDAMIKLNSDIYISFQLHNSVYLLLAKLIVNKKIVIAERTDPRFQKYGGVLTFLTKFLYPSANGFVFQTKQQGKYYDKKIRKKSVVIPNPINPDLQGIYGGVKKKNIVAVGRLVPEKNYPLLIKAFSKVNEKHPEHTLYIYGKGNELLKLKQLAKNLGLADKVVFEGFRKDVYSRISDAELYVITSDFEGMPNALMEAMVLGLPVISTATSGAVDLIKHGRNGLLIPIKDEKALTEAMLLLLGNEPLACTMGAEAAKIRETHSIDIVFRKWERYLQEITGEY